MPRQSEQKIKLLVLYEILREKTDEDHAMSTEEILNELRERGVNAERQALLRDMRALNDWGFEVLSYKKKSWYFYVADRKFEAAELRILIDAVQSASFITEKRTKELTEKLAGLAGKHKSELMKKNLVCYDTTKRNNKQVFYTIDIIETAIERGKKVSFVYYDLDVNRKKVYRKERARYEVNPLALVFTNDKYYLVCYNDKYRNLSHYRIDRMEQVAAEEAEITSEEKYRDFNPHRHRKEIFSMYVGETCEVTLEADNEMIEDILDKFGEKVKVHNRTEGTFCVSERIQLSPPFYAWIALHRGRIRIKSPEKAKTEMYEFLSHNYIV